MPPESCSLFDPADVDLAIDRLILEDDCAPVVQPPRPRLLGIRYDRAFEPAVREGYLMAQEAAQRGDREAYIARLESRFEFPRDLAQRVADGRSRLRAAVEECERRHAVARIGRSTNWRRAVVSLLLITVASALFGANRLATQRETARKLESDSWMAPRSAASAGSPPSSDRPAYDGRVERDVDGWVTRVSAGHPADALFTFCALATPGEACSGTEVLEFEPRFPGRRLGRFTLYADDRAWLIPIRRESGSGRWTIGTGLRPISPTAEAPLEEGRSPVWPYVPEFVPADEKMPA